MFQGGTIDRIGDRIRRFTIGDNSMSVSNLSMDFMLSAAQKERFVAEFRHRLEQAEALPILPEVARQLIQLRNDPNAGIPELVAVIEKDPSSAAQLLRYARLSTFGYGDRIKTISDAVQLVLGFEKALHMVLGLAAGKSLRMEPDGPLGRKNFWRHSVYTASLCQALAARLPAGEQPPLGLIYLAGLLHDIGYMLLGHLYPYEFSLLNQIVAKYPDMETRELELITLGISHDRVGMWLMKAWEMPEEVVVGVGEHYFPDYDGHHAVYPKLISIANTLLKFHESGGALGERYGDTGLENLGIGEEAFHAALDQVFGIASELEQVAEEMAA